MTASHIVKLYAARNVMLRRLWAVGSVTDAMMADRVPGCKSMDMQDEHVGWTFMSVGAQGIC